MVWGFKEGEIRPSDTDEGCLQSEVCPPIIGHDSWERAVAEAQRIKDSVLAVEEGSLWGITEN